MMLSRPARQPMKWRLLQRPSRRRKHFRLGRRGKVASLYEPETNVRRSVVNMPGRADGDVDANEEDFSIPKT
jgi:hypothetical protein